MQLTLAQVVAATGASFQGPAGLLEGGSVTGWSIDSRGVQPGDLFFAIKGEIQDGHAYVPAALKAGAVAAVVSETPDPLTQTSDVTQTSGINQTSGPLLAVPDVLTALQSIAREARRLWGRRIVAVTGSAGKTSTKDIIAELLSAHFQTGKTIGNFNNHLGLPLSILRLPEHADVAVLEMGMNHAGEIRALAQLARPDVGVVTNVGYAHVENFTGIEGIAAAKRELIEELPSDGVAVLNADDGRVRHFGSAHRGRSVTYGFTKDADIHPTEVTEGSGCTTFRIRDLLFETKLAGRHSLSNILAAIAVADVFGIPFEKLPERVARLSPSGMRGQRSVRKGITILNDSYNSNPEAVSSMLEVLRAEPAARRIAVLGEMRELGAFSEDLHRRMGEWVASTIRNPPAIFSAPLCAPVTPFCSRARAVRTSKPLWREWKRSRSCCTGCSTKSFTGMCRPFAYSATSPHAWRWPV